MGRIVLLNKKGLSLVEVMISLVIVLLVSLALMQTAMISIDANMNNVLRDEALALGEEYIIRARNIPFNTLSPATLHLPEATSWGSAGNLGWDYITSDIRPSLQARNIAMTLANGRYFRVYYTITPRGVDNRQLDITVQWIWKDVTYYHNVNSIVRNAL